MMSGQILFMSQMALWEILFSLTRQRWYLLKVIGIFVSVVWIFCFILHVFGVINPDRAWIKLYVYGRNI